MSEKVAGLVVHECIACHGVEYNVRLSVSRTDVLEIEVEQKQLGQRWKGEFSAATIEDLTYKASNYKSFPVFVRMLISGIQKSTDSVVVDLLKFSDLEALNKRGQKGGAQSINSQVRNRANNKRYLILTYLAEFDRVYFPLPLNPDTRASAPLGRPEAAAACKSEVIELQEQNRRLRDQLAMAEGQMARARGPTTEYKDAALERFRFENEQLVREKQELEERLDQLRTDSQRELARARSEADMLASDLETQCADVLQLREDLLKRADDKSDRQITLLKKQIQKLQDQLEEEREINKRTNRLKNADYQMVLQELKELRESDRALRVKLNEKIRELEMANRKLGMFARSGGAKHGFINASPQSRVAADRNRRSRSPSPSSFSAQSGSAARYPNRALRECTPPLHPNSHSNSNSNSGAHARHPRAATRSRSSSPRARDPVRPLRDGKENMNQDSNSRISNTERDLRGHTTPLKPAATRADPSRHARSPSPSVKELTAQLASQELSDIDARLDALTSYLRKARRT